VEVTGDPIDGASCAAAPIGKNRESSIVSLVLMGLGL